MPYMWNLKRNDTNGLTYKTERHSQTYRMNLRLQAVGKDREFGMDRHTLLYLKWITNKDLLCSTGALLSVMWQPGWEGSLRRMCVHAKSLKSCLTLCGPVDCSPPCSSIHGSGVPCPPPEGLPDPEIKPVSFVSPASADWFFTTNAT